MSRLIGTWMMPSMSYSTGSSVVMILSRDVVQLVERGVERRRLAGAGRAGDEDDAVGLVDQLAELGEHVRRPCRPCSRSSETTVRSSTRMTTLSPNMVGKDADAHVDRVAADVQLDAAVLRQAALGDVEVGHDLDAAGDGRGQVARRRHHFVEHAVAAVAHLVFVFERLEVDVAGLVLDGQQQHHVDELADRGGVGHFHHGLEVDRGLVAVLAASSSSSCSIWLMTSRCSLPCRRRTARWPRSRSDSAAITPLTSTPEEVAQVVERRRVLRVAHGDGQRLVFLNATAAAPCRPSPSSRGRARSARRGSSCSRRLTTFRPNCSASALQQLVLGDQTRRIADLADRLVLGTLGFLEDLPELVSSSRKPRSTRTWPSLPAAMTHPCRGLLAVLTGGLARFRPWIAGSDACFVPDGRAVAAGLSSGYGVIRSRRTDRHRWS